MGLGAKIWPPLLGDAQPTNGQMASLIALAAINALSFGLGIAFLLLGWGWVQKLPGLSKTWIVALYLSVAWTLLNWWPHVSLHGHIGEDLDGLIAIDWGFHTTAILGGLIIIWSLHKIARALSQPRP